VFLATTKGPGLLGELQATQGTLALALSNTIEGARTNARSSLSEGYHSICLRFIAGWQQWGESLAIPDAPPDVQREAYLSAVVLAPCERRELQYRPGYLTAVLAVTVTPNPPYGPFGVHFIFPDERALHVDWEKSAVLGSR
jgi:hypothetical protein